MEDKSTVSFYVVSLSGLNLHNELLWTEESDADQYNDEEHGGQGTIFELEVVLDWTKSVRVK